MSKINFKKVAERVIQTINIEKNIEDYKVFYGTHLLKVKNRKEIVPQLYALSLKFYENNPSKAHFLNTELLQLKSEAKELIRTYFGEEVLAIFSKTLPKIGPSKDYYKKVGDSFWLGLLASFAETMETFNTKAMQEWNYQRNFIIFLNNCFVRFGLHENILKRNPENHKRFNLVIEHYYRSRKPVTVIKPLLTYTEFDKQFRKLYMDMHPIKFEGQLIPFSKISKVKITTTLLKDDEIMLFAEKNNFKWDNSIKDIQAFVTLCLDETEQYHPNPFDKDTYINEIDKILIAQTFDILKPFPSSLKSFKQALQKYEKQVFQRNILDDLRLSLEDLLKQVLKNKKSLENQLPEIGKYQKEKGTSAEIVNMLQKLIDYYGQYQNNYVKHNDKVNEDEIEFVINLTSTFMKFIARKKME